eukprot:CAMPEP_0119108740 /NCGR_PEP_ID=MMETSP1180-20130426/15633_1 /TAXON_ID=3052 ORGANISM="Chlamydomonas cf sp, Strain CCMP681" /NCGR_SAMPLE_ID=MMETSP1180 /ASSEMBLY_ACC=CAM_ASM_000741 /LENGTH=45 /DNA_ID= /DNA_START= /DNA_END= /DNA_ORIENTATION=
MTVYECANDPSIDDAGERHVLSIQLHHGLQPILYSHGPEMQPIWM